VAKVPASYGERSGTNCLNKLSVAIPLIGLAFKLQTCGPDVGSGRGYRVSFVWWPSSAYCRSGFYAVCSALPILRY
jgi:hypothetical protein